MKNNRGIAVVMLLLALPLLLSLIKITTEVSILVFQRQKMREACFLAALSGLKLSTAEAALTALATQLPESEVTASFVPDSETPAKNRHSKSLVFNLKSEKSEFNCGARALWKNGTWQYEIILDRF
jgi:Flp pilus assembly protein TadG